MMTITNIATFVSVADLTNKHYSKLKNERDTTQILPNLRLGNQYADKLITNHKNEFNIFRSEHEQMHLFNR